MMPDRSFATWLCENWARVVLLTTMILVLSLFFAMMVGSNLHQSEIVERLLIDVRRVEAGTQRNHDEIVRTREEVEDVIRRAIGR
jgi:hypothetical protein